MENAVVEEKIDRLIYTVGEIKTEVALLTDSSKRHESMLGSLEHRLYNGGKGDITRIKRGMSRLERTKTLFSGAFIAFGSVGSLCAFALVVVEIWQKVVTGPAVNAATTILKH